MLRIELMPWEKARAHAAPIRFTVFVEEQGVPLDIELDKQDALSVHAVVFDQEGPVATGRLLPDGRIGRMAVLKQWRRRGIGALILEALTEEARKRGHIEVVLSAQLQALEFYRSHGFTPEGKIYDEAGILHQKMRRRIQS